MYSEIWGDKFQLEFAPPTMLPNEEVPKKVTQHNEPDWLAEFKSNIGTYIEKCSAKTRAAVANNEKLEVCLKACVFFHFFLSLWS